MKQMPIIRWGMIGVGSVAEHKSGPAFSQAFGGSLVAVASRRKDTAMAYALRHGVPHVFTSPNDLIDSDLVDAVYIATPPASHFPLALEVARVGKPCCIEKPMTIYMSDALKLCDIFRAKDVPLFVSYYRRSLERFNAIRESICDGAIGEISCVRWTLSRVKSKSIDKSNWRVTLSEAPGGLFEDLACHGMDLFDYFFGPVTRIRRSQLSATAEDVVPDCVEAWWEHGTDLAGHGKWDFDATAREDKVTISGSNGTICFAMFDEEPITICSGTNKKTLFISNPTPIQLPHVTALNQALQGQVVHPSTGHSAARTAWVSEQILRGPSSVIQYLRP